MLSYVSYNKWCDVWLLIFDSNEIDKSDLITLIIQVNWAY